MALLQNIDYAPGQDTMQETFDKLNATIDTINSVLGGGADGDYISKASSADFDFEFKNVQHSVKQSAKTIFGPAGTVFESGTLTTPADATRDSFIFVSILTKTTLSHNLTLELFKNGVVTDTAIFSVADTNGNETIATTWHFAQIAKSAGSEYKIRATTSTTVNVPVLVISMDSSL